MKVSKYVMLSMITCLSLGGAISAKLTDQEMSAVQLRGAVSGLNANKLPDGNYTIPNQTKSYSSAQLIDMYKDKRIEWLKEKENSIAKLEANIKRAQQGNIDAVRAAVSVRNGLELKSHKHGTEEWIQAQMYYFNSEIQDLSKLLQKELSLTGLCG